MLAPRLDDPSSTWHEDIALAPCMDQGRRSRQIEGSECWHRTRSSTAQCLSQARTRGEASLRPSYGTHSSSHGTHGLEGAWGVTLEAKRDRCGDRHGSLRCQGTFLGCQGKSLRQQVSQFEYKKESCSIRSPNQARTPSPEGIRVALLR